MPHCGDMTPSHSNLEMIVSTLAHSLRAQEKAWWQEHEAAAGRKLPTFKVGLPGAAHI